MCSVHLGRRGLFVGLLAVSFVAVACAAKQPPQPTAPASSPPVPAQGSAPAASQAPTTTIGAADAPVTIVEYGDYL